MALKSVARANFLRGALPRTSLEVCVFCQARNRRPSAFSPPTTSSWTSTRPASHRSNNSGPRRVRADPQRSPQELRAEFDKKNRGTHFATMKSQRLIAMPAAAAETIIRDILKSPPKTISADLALGLVEANSRYKIDLEDITNLAITTYRIPDADASGSKLPPSPHKNISRTLLLSCCKAKEPGAIMHIMNAVYLASSKDSARQIASLFSPAEIRSCRQDLEALADTDFADAKTLLGLFAEREGNEQAAFQLYEQALESKNVKYNMGEVHPMGLPRFTPWNALGTLLINSQNPELREKAKHAFTKGALEGDDPVAYYHLASFEDKESGKWLQYMHKAAGAGHREAMYELGHFFMKINSQGRGKVDTSHLHDKTVVRSLWWLTMWKEDSPRNLGLEWFTVAAESGHKPSMLELADVSEIEDETDVAIGWLQTIADPPPSDQAEEWPILAAEAKKKLLRMKRKTLA
ncbi:hypothetical protein BU24DRAFT_421767 [Aaosphaeria arxii CBS 175.79]|uniref:HCP-like protein n=1 Tax=Aaosphaeria arxii CBS 175.79 TaxID=1450172 RepID=A0A6A5XRA1_9PLEO|nr:uncharacterized protein BU24DRAFT_421767 [Aaosphaeria arxii CBS 175.79]KAF2015463.1 hypothetical protein BU24DRAFT_421767 [Aaosphaeria arxii CBS 175.79]